jgi:hypothetical protein
VAHPLVAPHGAARAPKVPEVAVCQRHQRERVLTHGRRQSDIDGRQAQRGAEPVRQAGGQEAEGAADIGKVLVCHGAGRREVGLLGGGWRLAAVGGGWRLEEGAA